MPSFNSYKQDTAERLASLEAKMENVYLALSDIRGNHLVHLQQTMEHLEQLVLCRPTWLSSIVITTVTAILAALLGAHFGR